MSFSGHKYVFLLGVGPVDIPLTKTVRNTCEGAHVLEELHNGLGLK